MPIVTPKLMLAWAAAGVTIAGATTAGVEIAAAARTVIKERIIMTCLLTSAASKPRLTGVRERAAARARPIEVFVPCCSLLFATLEPGLHERVVTA